MRTLEETLPQAVERIGGDFRSAHFTLIQDGYADAHGRDSDGLGTKVLATEDADELITAMRRMIADESNWQTGHVRVITRGVRGAKTIMRVGSRRSGDYQRPVWEFAMA